MELGLGYQSLELAADNPLHDLVEELARQAHDIYQAEAHRQVSLGMGQLRHPEAYKDLCEHMKDFDRALARWIIARMFGAD